MSAPARALLSAATLANIEEAGASVLILAEGLEKEDFLRSGLTRSEVCRQMQVLGQSLALLSDDAHIAMPELDRDVWRRTVSLLAREGAERDEAAWFGVRALVPATLMWLRVYRQNQPELFSFST